MQTRTYLRGVVVALLAASFACGSAQDAAPSEARRGVAPPAAATLRLVARAAGLHRSTRKPFELATERGVVVLYDAESGPTDSWPCVSFPGRSTAPEDRCLDLGIEDGGTRIDGWAHAEILDDRRTIVALLESQVEGPGESLDVVISSDGGRTWSPRGSVRKPHYMAGLVGLDTGGALGKRWKLTIELADCAGCGIEPGVYRYESSDDGSTWKAAAIARGTL